VSFFKKPEAERLDWLGRVAFFEGFEPEELRRVADLSSEVHVEPGTVVIDQGDTGTECFVLVEGTASVYVGTEHVATLHPGSVMGEMALVDHRPRSASVVADTALTLLRFDARQFRTLLQEMPKASERVMTLLTARLRRDQT
jgi:CRP/FNR family cyclic AMP-dependent transcriptional regulator